MKICVLGAGVIGLTTAWWLAEAGHEVTIIDRHEAAGAEASAANGGQLSYTFVAPLASPAMLLKLPSLLMLRDGPIRIRAGVDLLGCAFPSRLSLRCRPGDRIRAAETCCFEPSRIGAPDSSNGTCVWTENRWEACGVPDRDGVQFGARRGLC